MITMDSPLPIEDTELDKDGITNAFAHVVKKLIRIEISTFYHLLSVSQCLCNLPHNETYN